MAAHSINSQKSSTSFYLVFMEVIDLVFMEVFMEVIDLDQATYRHAYMFNL